MDIVDFLLLVPISGEIKRALRSSYGTIRDLTCATSEHLAEQCALELPEAVALCETLQRCSRPPRVSTAYAAIQAWRNEHRFISFCSQSLDSIFGGGIPVGQLTEISGQAGCGKTQLCLQLLVMVNLPQSVDGLAAQAVIVSTEAAFATNRLVEIATATELHCVELGVTGLTVKSIMDSVYCFQCLEHYQLMATITNIPAFLTSHPKVKLLIIDSIASPFRTGFENNYIQRNNILSQLACLLRCIAIESKIAVVVTNQVTTKPINGVMTTVPALGETWSHAPHTRLWLTRDSRGRRATLVKSTTRPRASTFFVIADGGIRDSLCVSEAAGFATED